MCHMCSSAYKQLGFCHREIVLYVHWIDSWFLNEEGLVSVNNNLWEWGADVGEVYYGMAGEVSFGSIESGGYEGSNVDIAAELSNMIMAQRGIEANSRVFDTANSILQTLVYLGRG